MFNGDCMEFMANVPDKHYELAIVDPPYGIGASSPSKKPATVRQQSGNVLRVHSSDYGKKTWDEKPYTRAEFLALERVSGNQIVWGCNFFDFQLQGGRIIWDKMNGETDQHDAEIAYCSMGNRVDLLRYKWNGMMQGEVASKDYASASRQKGNKALNEKRIHPTQKPVPLYRWLLENYAKPGDKILDTHGGSGSIVIACYTLGFALDWVELDPDYYEAAVKRFKQYLGKPEEMNGTKFDAPPQLKMFTE